jgi:hypothetical protein
LGNSVTVARLTLEPSGSSHKPFFDKALTKINQSDLAQNLVQIIEQPELARFIEAWVELPGYIKQSIKALLKCSGREIRKIKMGEGRTYEYLDNISTEF